MLDQVGSSPLASGDLVEKLDAARAKLRCCLDILDNQILIGQPAVNRLTLACLLAGGHAMIVGVPGLGKTRLFRNLAGILSQTYNRVSCTPDLLPADILGSKLVDIGPDGTKAFRFLPGPVFSQILLIDEINRAPPVLQSAFLEAMEEKYVTVDGKRWPLPQGYTSLATRNPIEQEGTYPLSEAQVDRFMVEIEIGHLSARDEFALLKMEAEGRLLPDYEGDPILRPGEFSEIRELVMQIPVGEAFLESAVDLTRVCRPDNDIPLDFTRENVLYGPGYRAEKALLRMTKAMILLDAGNDSYAADRSIVRELAVPVLAHRIGMSHMAHAKNVGPRDVIKVAMNYVFGG